MTRSLQSTPAPVRPWPWWRRHKTISVLLVLAVVAGGLTWWRPWERCGAGMAEADGQCVGLSLDLTPFSDDETTIDLQQRIAAQNAQVTGDDFITVVVLNSMTPEPGSDSAALLNVHHGVMGAIAAQQRVNTTPAVGSQTPPVKLLLANYGGRARQQAEAVEQIIAHRDEHRIVAVIGLGQSLAETRAAASALSAAKIAVVSAVASADNMNRDPTTEQFIERFYRITPTNTDAANAAVSYLRGRDYRKVMLVRDDSSSDIYTQTLGDAFEVAYRNGFPGRGLSEAFFTSPSEQLEGVTRDTYLQPQFGRIYARMCQESPELVYFAGRGADLKAFLRAVGQGGACDGLSKIDVLTSDDASSLLGEPLPEMTGTEADVYYTSVATAGMWDGQTSEVTNQHNYRGFAEAFAATGLHDDLRDGYAMAHHDALLLAVGAARQVPNVGENTRLVADWIDNHYDCAHPLPGATGKIAYAPETHGNPIDKALPIMLLEPGGRIEQKAIAWTTGTPFETSCR
ncbi:ABC-type branched-chain amino acid transport system, substrate-binding protein [Saccharopolyspora kobensis]|uniref:ABC-type branched-chain amino acid transport system, substrate-binding protein n=1 Tax=Saccharopolyspora kobensis TaxID=146035 RepID=A0A1H6AR55_9PSEU|nr:ABC transporter substrate-binding protein [Saccharopolyspora kobensis]SEG50567.1 ABC-type branched-chain amino acid transport system, substrate-binding protein [Saccharopolyspora kobensis]SFE76181.1 ABC-type branched-chain amino acid transport system, substrate-binding protein [Saccharopolyspora kobensis]